jgi:hypothetical protein
MYLVCRELQTAVTPQAEGRSERGIGVCVFVFREEVYIAAVKRICTTREVIE